MHIIAFPVRPALFLLFAKVVNAIAKNCMRPAGHSHCRRPAGVAGTDLACPVCATGGLSMRQASFWLAGLAALVQGAAIAAAPTPTLDASYSLVSSSTAPVTNWGFSKGRISVRQLDARHVLIVLACEWKREPKAVCGEHYFAQWQESGLYIQDMNTDAMRIYADPAAHTLTIISRGYDAKASVRRDLYKMDEQELTDPVLIRRLKREQANADSKENARVFGPYAKWSYTNNRIEFQQPPSATP